MVLVPVLLCAELLGNLVVERGRVIEEFGQALLDYSVIWNSIFLVSVTRLEASRISRETRFPSSS